MTKVCIDVTTWHNDDAEDSNEPFSYRGTTDGQVNKVYVSENAYDFGYRGMETDLTGEIWAVYCEYTTGDTFGSDYEAAIVGLLATEEEALALMNEAESAKSYGPLSNGFYVPWIGYFETLLALHVTKVEPKSRHRHYHR